MMMEKHIREKTPQKSPQISMNNQFVPRAFGTSGIKHDALDQQGLFGHGFFETNLSLIQPKLIIGSPDNKYEREANRVAEKVMRQEPCPQCQDKSEDEYTFQNKLIANQIVHLKREGMGKDSQINQVCGQTSQASPRLENEIRSLEGSGQPLAESTRAFFEPRLGYDFSKVRVHTDAKAAKLAWGVNSRAFTVGRDVVFGAGQYAPGTAEGQRLLAHELTHVVQQKYSIGNASAMQRDENLTQSTITPEYAQNLSDRELEDEIRHLRELLLQASVPDEALIGNLTTLEDEVSRRYYAENLTDQELEEQIHFLREHAQILSYEDLARLTTLEAEVSRRSESLMERLRELLDFNSPLGWHHTLPQSNIRRINFIPAQSRRGTPRLGGGYPSHPSLQPMADSQEAVARQMLISDIRRRLSSVHIPTSSGQLGMWHSSPGRWGYAYRSRDYESGSEASAEHQRFLRDAELENIGLDPQDRRISGLWSEFRRILTQEGDTSALNAYDDQLVTIGAGFSARSGDAGWIYNRMPLEFRQRLYEYGICVNNDNTFTVLDLERGVTETGDNALHILQVNPSMLGVLIQESQSRIEMSQGMTSREWMLRAQFERFMERNREVPDSVFNWKDSALRHFAFRLRHWMGSLSWSGIVAHCSDMNDLANYASHTIYDARLRAGRQLSEAYIQSRIRGIANNSGLAGGNIVFR